MPQVKLVELWKDPSTMSSVPTLKPLLFQYSLYSRLESAAPIEMPPWAEHPHRPSCYATALNYAWNGDLLSTFKGINSNKTLLALNTKHNCQSNAHRQTRTNLSIQLPEAHTDWQAQILIQLTETHTDKHTNVNPIT